MLRKNSFSPTVGGRGGGTFLFQVNIFSLYGKKEKKKLCAGKSIFKDDFLCPLLNTFRQSIGSQGERFAFPFGIVALSIWKSSVISWIKELYCLQRMRENIFFTLFLYNRTIAVTLITELEIVRRPLSPTQHSYGLKFRGRFHLFLVALKTSRVTRQKLVHQYKTLEYIHWKSLDLRQITVVADFKNAFLKSLANQVELCFFRKRDFY